MQVQPFLPEQSQLRSVLHYTGADDDRGGVMSVIRALAGPGTFDCLLGVNPEFVQRRSPALPTLVLPKVRCETIDLRTFWRARLVARAARDWLGKDQGRIFHAHSRAGMVAAVWLVRGGERRVVASVHCYGRQRWFYRWSAAQLRGGLYWLSPAMKRHYGLPADSWAQCIPGCVPAAAVTLRKRAPEKSPVLRLGGIGALVRWKGWHLVVAALALLPEHLRGRITFCHIGAPGAAEEEQRYAAQLQSQTRAQGLAGQIEWRGEQSSPAALLGEIDCLVVASDKEPFSIAVLEALAAGVPVLAADSGGASDLLEPGRTGWFFKTGDVSDLARALAALLESQAFAAAKIMPDNILPFTAPVVAKRWAQVYAAL